MWYNRLYSDPSGHGLRRGPSDPMQVSCPQCGASQRLPPSGPRPGQRVRCPRCSLVFVPPDQGGAAARERTDPRPRPPPVPPPAPRSSGPGGDGWSGPDWTDTETADPTPAARPQGAGVAARGTSAIRAQEGRAPRPAGGAPGGAATGGGGWRARTPEGTELSFADLTAVRAWTEAHPGRSVVLSRDGVHWQAPESLLGRTPTRPVKVPAGTGPVRRPAADPGAGRSWGWTLAALGAVAACGLTAAVTMQRQGWVDLSPWVPWRALGLEAVARIPAAPPTVEARFQAAVRAGRAAWEAGRLTQAALDLEQALQLQDDPAVRADLVRIYELLGARERVEATRSQGPGAGAED